MALLICFFISFPTFLMAQEEPGPLILQHADKLESSGSGGDIVNLIGNVHFYHDKADLYSQRATWYQASGLVQFVDSVLITEEGRRITAQTVTYYRRDRRVSALHDVVLKDSIQNIELYCQKADYFRDTKQLDAFGNPKLILNPADDSSRMTIDALKLSYFGADAHGSAYDSVVITRHDMVAHAGQADFYRQPEHAVLVKKPVIIDGQNQLSGDTISIFTENRKLNRVLVQGDAKAIYKAMPDTAVAEYTTAEIDGRQLEAFFTNDKIQQMVSRQNATSLYAPAATDTLVRGTNIASGDSITLFFTKDTIKRVFISGGAQGEYIEPKFVENKATFDTTKYSGDEINYDFDQSEIRLNKNSAMHYHDMALTSGQVRYDTKTRILVAEGLGTDSSGAKMQSPVLKQGTEELDGDKMSYNIDTKKGQVRIARTKYEGGFYTGEALRQTSQDVLLVSQGNYTSCDKQDDPHYHFHSNRMKMINKDKVIARPVILYIGQLPVFAIPYYVFPVHKGRHSGFLPFQLGDFRNGGRFIRNVGYYWAASDYYDLQSSLDFYENSYTTVNGVLQYNLRYKLSGSLSGSYTRQANWDLSRYVQRIDNRWMFSFSHNQYLDQAQTMTLKGSGTFLSDKNYISQTVYDPAKRLNRSIKSDLSFNKNWPGQYISMTVLASQDWNLDSDSKTEYLPSFSISRQSMLLFPPASKTKKKSRVRPNEIIEEPKSSWYNNINFGISTMGQNFRQRTKNPDSSFSERNYQTIDTRSNLSFSPKLLGFLNLSPNINLTHSLVRLEPNQILDSLNIPTRKFVSRLSYNMGVTVSTTVYGMVSPNKFGLLGLRHVMTPSVSYSFTPAISKNHRYFNYVGGIGSSLRSKTMSFALGNSFQAKYKSGETEKKIDLFRLSFGSSYNFTAGVGAKKLGDLSTSLISDAIPKINITLTTTHSFYNDISNTIRRSFLNPRLTSINFTTGFTGGYHPGGGGKKEDETDQAQKIAFGSPSEGSAQSANLGLDFDVSYDYSETRNFGSKTKIQWAKLSTGIQPTSNWHVDYNVDYDLVKKQITSQGLTITRDLHCWEAALTWNPIGAVAGYYAVIRIKSLKDIKVESSHGGLGPRGSFNY